MHRPRVDQILRETWRFTGVPVDRICSRSRQPRCVDARALAARAMRDLRCMSWPEVAAALGRKSHSGIMETTKSRMSNPDFAARSIQFERTLLTFTTPTTPTIPTLEAA